MRVFEKMLNRKLGLDKVNIGIQTDPVQFNSDKDIGSIINIRTTS